MLIEGAAKDFDERSFDVAARIGEIHDIAIMRIADVGRFAAGFFIDLGLALDPGLQLGSSTMAVRPFACN